MPNLRLQGPAGSLDISEEAWGRLMDLALRYGWKPAGTLPPEDVPVDETWDAGRYIVGEGQAVSPEDAQDLASALNRSLPDIPEYNHPAYNPSQRWQPGSHPGSWRGYLDIATNRFHEVEGRNDRPSLASTLDYLKGNRRVLLEELVQYCRRGGFRIRRAR